MKIASIDIGTNTILMLIAEYDYSGNRILPLKNLIRIPRIGKDVAKSWKIGRDKIDELIEILRDYSVYAKNEGCSAILASGTNAFRLALNSSEIISQVYKVTGVKISVIEPLDEALFSYLGVVGEADSYKNLVIDIGGGSTEVILGEGKEIIALQSFQLGVVELTEKFIESYPVSTEKIHGMRKYVGSVINNFLSEIKAISNVYAIAGTPTTLASLKAGVSDLEEEKVHNTRLYTAEIDDFADQFSLLTPEKLLMKYSVSKGREDVILAGTLILSEILKKISADFVRVSAYGLRYGAIRYYVTMNAGKYFE
ncbi:MAG: hypothetical protein HUU54_05070 [Ignavibacteriaceae bacterium]|nr:hypothetical protein [Ignavibacteriaceae bacterium]